MDFFLALTIGILFGIGIFQMLRRDLIKAAMGFSMLFTAVNLFLLGVGAYNGEVAPYTELVEHGQPSDPLVQALILTAIVIGAGSYAVLLAVINVISARYKSVKSDEIRYLKE